MKKTLVIFAIAVFCIATLLSPIYVLEVRVDGTEELVYQQKAKLGDTFDVKWIHSVTKQPVIETYQLVDIGQIPITKMVFDEFGPNLPARPEFNQEWIIADGKFTVINYERIFERVPVTIGAVIANHTLIYNGQITPLKDVFRPGGYVHIGLAKKAWGQFLFEEVKIWQKSKKKLT